MRPRSSFRFSRLTWPFKVVALALVPIQAATVTPVRLVAEVASASGDSKTAPRNKAVAAVDPTQGIKVNRTLPAVTAPKALSFSDAPTDSEFFHSRVFSEPLIPVGGRRDAEEDRALALAITNFSKAANADETDLLTAHLVRFPNSPWRASLLANLGALYRSTAYWSKALNAWEESWSLLHGETDSKAAMLADFVLGELAQLNARLGRFDRLESLFQEIAERDVRGPATEKVAGARQGLALMNERPQDAFRCGPMALERILRGSDASVALPRPIFESRSTRQGMSLTQVSKLAAAVGMKYQMAKRSPGAKIIYPSVINWKVGHFAALTKEVGRKFLAQDPTFSRDVWITEKTIEEEGSGYYLVPAGPLPSGWRTVSAKEGGTVWGKGNAGANNEPPPPCVADSIKCSDCSAPSIGMADYNVDSARVSLTISDTPVGYTPPRGPAVNFTVYYQQREIAPVSTPTYSNLGNKWSFGWLGYLVVDPANESANAVAYGPGGGTLSYLGFNSTTQSYAPQFETNVLLVKTGPGSYEKRFPDGSRQIFDLPDGATVYPQMIFMTQSIDPQGNTLTYTYDGSFRLVALSDALGQVTTLSYELGSDPLKVTKVTDPFGRIATLEYNVAGLLWKVTDAIGLVSEFTYASGDFISKMTTPYGVTTFVVGPEGSRSLEITDPKGGKERIEYGGESAPIPNSAPAGQAPPGAFNENLSVRNTFYWDKKAMAELHPPLDYTKARITHWLHSTDLNVASGIVESRKLPLENWVFMAYTGGSGMQVGVISKPASVSRVLDDGTVQAYQYEYNSFGKVTKATDPFDRETTYIYDVDGIDLLEVRQTTGVLNDLLASYTYDTQHRRLTTTDASGQITTNTYYPSGQIHTVTNAKQEMTTYNYDASGYLQNIVGAVPGAITSFTYDGFGRVRTTTDSEGYSVTTDYDAIGGDTAKTLNRVAKVTYPDGTYEEVTYDRLDPEWTRDRLGRWSQRFYDALRHVIATQDPLSQITTYDWCNCGSVEAMIDPKGNRTSWSRDVQSRVTEKTFADGTKTHYIYEATTSRLATMTDAKGQSTNYQYFSDDNLKQVSYTNAQIATPSVDYTYDPNYDRIATMSVGAENTVYSYNPISTSIFGAGQLASVNGPLADDTITYSYDELDRLTNRSINAAANAASVVYDSLGRTQSVTNLLGTFGYFYVGATGHPDHVDFPNGQQRQYSYFDNLGDQRLKQIKNLNASAALISQFDYTYNPAGEIVSWTQANSGVANPRRYDFGYDANDQVRRANSIDTVTQATVHQYDYDYDAAGNRQTTQIDGAVTTSTANNLNQMTSQASGGKMHFRGQLSEPSVVTVAGNPASVDAAGKFDGVANVNIGTNTVPVVATDASGNSRTNNYEVTVPSGATKTLVYDLNGNVTNDGSKTYEWDAANRLVGIDYTGTANRSEFAYDGVGRRVSSIEKSGGVIVSAKKLVWDGVVIAEERDASDAVTKRFYSQGVQLAGSPTTNLFYTRDHLGSIREMVGSDGTIRARYEYDPFGIRTKLSGDLEADFGFTGHYYHLASNLDLTFYRAYDPELGRWLSRDPIGEDGGLNLYSYCEGNGIGRLDVLGDVGSNYDSLMDAGMAGARRDMDAIWGKGRNIEASGLLCKKTTCGGKQCYTFTGPVIGHKAELPADPKIGRKAGIYLFTIPENAECPSGYDAVGFHYAHPTVGDTISEHPEDIKTLQQKQWKLAVSGTPQPKGHKKKWDYVHFDWYPR